MAVGELRLTTVGDAGESSTALVLADTTPWALELKLGLLVALLGVVGGAKLLLLLLEPPNGASANGRLVFRCASDSIESSMTSTLGVVTVWRNGCADGVPSIAWCELAGVSSAGRYLGGEAEYSMGAYTPGISFGLRSHRNCMVTTADTGCPCSKHVSTQRSRERESGRAYLWHHVE